MLVLSSSVSASTASIPATLASSSSSGSSPSPFSTTVRFSASAAASARTRLRSMIFSRFLLAVAPPASARRAARCCRRRRSAAAPPSSCSLPKTSITRARSSVAVTDRPGLRHRAGRSAPARTAARPGGCRPRPRAASRRAPRAAAAACSSTAQAAVERNADELRLAVEEALDVERGRRRQPLHHRVGDRVFRRDHHVDRQVVAAVEVGVDRR